MAPAAEPLPTIPELHLSLCRRALRVLAPGELDLASAAIEEFRRAPARYRDNPLRLTDGAGGELGGAGIAEFADQALPYVTALSGMGLQVVLDAVKDEVKSQSVGKLRSWLRRRRGTAPAAPEIEPLTPAQLARIGATIDAYGQRWELPATETARLHAVLLECFVAQFGTRGPASADD